MDILQMKLEVRVEKMIPKKGDSLEQSSKNWGKTSFTSFYFSNLHK